MDETVTVGDTELRIEETDDGFEAVEVEDGEPSSKYGIWLRFQDSKAEYGCEIPVEADFHFEYDRGTTANVAWKTDDDRSDLRSYGYSDFDYDEEKYDGHAAIDTTQIERIEDE